MKRALIALGLLTLIACDDGGDGETTPQPVDLGPTRDMSSSLDAARFDVPRFDVGVTPTPDQGTTPTPDRGVGPDPDRGVGPDPDQGVNPDPDQGIGPDPDQGVGPNPDRGVGPDPDMGPIPDMAPPPVDMEPVEMPCERVFVYRDTTGVGSVALAGDFEGWAGSVPMTDPDGDGYYTASVQLEPGEYLYKIVVDNVWITDPVNPVDVDDGHNGRNSVATHTCPFNPTCITGADCTPAAPICEYYSCRGCACPQGEVCDDQGHCVTPSECAGDGDCHEPGARCEDGACVGKPCSTQLFSLAEGHAIGADMVYVTGSFNGWLEPGEGAVEMQNSGGAWTASVADLRNGAYQYKFIISRGGGVEWIPDPENDLQDPDGFGSHNSVFNVDCGCTDASQCLEGLICQANRCVPEDPGPVGECGDMDTLRWEDSVLYFVMVDRFFNSDGMSDYVDGVSGWEHDGASGQYEGGDLPGVTQKLPYLTDLGISAIWLSAPYENRNYRGPAIDESADSHMYSAYHGYWPRPDNIDYSDMNNPQPRPLVEPRIGNADDLHALVGGAHDAGMLVAFDYVMNHVDIDSGLFHAHEHDGWFARNQNGDFVMCADGNWDDPFWGTRCAFTNYLPAFNYDNQDALNWSVNDAIWWAKEFDLDGYRLDAIKHVPESWLTTLRWRLGQEIQQHRGGRFYLVGETFTYFDRDLLRYYVGDDRLDGQFDFPQKRLLCEAIFHGMPLRDFANWMDENDHFYGQNSLMSTWIGNHDIPRAIHFANREMGCTEGSGPHNGWTPNFPQPGHAEPYERLGVAFAVLLTNPGVPLIYYGDEIGLAGGGDPDNRRVMPWDGLNAHQEALRERVRKLNHIRANNKVLARGARETLSTGEHTWVYRMTGCGGGDVYVAINRADVSAWVDFPQGDYTNLLDDQPAAGGAYELAPRSYMILRAN